MLKKFFKGDKISEDELDDFAEPSNKKKPSHKHHANDHDGGGGAQIVVEEGDSPNSQRKITKSQAAAAQSINKKHDSMISNDDADMNSGDEFDGSESDDIEPVDVLLQFIPYYGQGDPANDSIVRSTLTNLSVEDIDSKDEYGNTLLLLACQYRCEDLVRIMLNKGADPNAVNSSGACCLHFACYRESASMPVAKVLLKCGANPDIAETTYGCTPLHYCAGTGDISFVKLLLSYGAQINALDSYNYTCVDYAREAGMTDVADFLQSKLNSLSKQMSFKSLSSMDSPYSSASQKMSQSLDDLSSWEPHMDPDSGGKYYINSRTGECLWESELKRRLASVPASPSFTANVNEAPKTTALSAQNVRSQEEELRKQQSFQSKLVVFFTTHDPSRLVEVEVLAEEYKGREAELFKLLAAQYIFNGHAETKENKKTGAQSDSESASPVIASVQGKVTDINLVDAGLLSEIAHEEQKKFELQLQEEASQLRKQFESQMREEKNTFIQTISEKDGLVARLKSDIDALEKAKSSKEEEIKSLGVRISHLQEAGGESLSKLEGELEAAQALCQELRGSIALLQEELQSEKEKTRTLETTISKITEGNEEMIAREQAAADERAQKTREREEQHKLEVQSVEERAKNSELKLKTEINKRKAEYAQKETELLSKMEQLRKDKESEIDALERDLAQLKSQFAQEISSANMQIEHAQSIAQASGQRADEAEKFMESVKAEIADAKVVQKYNLQLHKDLQREQQARKKLHNDMEDLKGKIRVYVRIRPFSTKEREKSCEEAVLKDGKMTVLIKGLGGEPSSKKYFDFDQVFGGSMTEGNSQADVFRDTKHLMQSVIDGYNVCIFAYGQTGAGKSFTMIGAADIGNCLDENGEFDELAGITPRAVSEIFRLLNERTAQIDFLVEIQMFQLYRDALEDLLRDPASKKQSGEDKDIKKVPPLKITLAEHSPTGLVFVEGAACLTAATPGDVMKIFAKGSSRRTTASTQMNAESSRSHLICCLTLKMSNKRTGKESLGKLTLVDLAGSERNDKSGATGDGLKEAQSINKSLSALGDVIAALTTNSQHIPYRNHPLTMLMSDSIGGNAKTLMFVNASPADYNTNETNSSLSFAARCKDVTNAVASGSGVQAAQLNSLKKELAKLKKGGPAPTMMPPGGSKLARPDMTSKLT